MFGLNYIRSLRNSGRDGRRFYIVSCVVLTLVNLFVSFLLSAFGSFGAWLQEALFGFNQFKVLGIPLTCIGLTLPLVIGWMVQKLRPETISHARQWCQRAFASPFFRIGLALLAIGVFYALRNEYVNPDGLAFEQKFAHDVPTKGAHVVHDEMWELYFHSRFWFYTNKLWHWSIKYSYQVASACAGGIFILLLMYYCSRLVPEKPIAAFLLCLCGGYVQLFFGDVENYTLTATWIMGYFLASLYFLQGRVSVVVPAVLLAIAMTFHLLAAFLVPSLLYLFWFNWRRGAKKIVVISILAIVAIGCLTLLFFHFNHLPIANLWYKSQAFGYSRTIIFFLLHPWPRCYFDLFNLAFLLVPCFIFLMPLLFFKRIEWNPINVHLGIAAAVMTIFVVLWHPNLGVYADWNLFAAAALPISFLAWRNVLAEKSVWIVHSISYLGWLFFMHSYTWIVSNHFNPHVPVQ